MLLQISPFFLLLRCITDPDDHEWEMQAAIVLNLENLTLNFLTMGIKAFLLAISYFRVSILGCTLHRFESS